MKKFFFIVFIFTLFTNCDKSENNNQNQFIPNQGFSIQINTNLPSYSQLQFASNAVYVNQANAGVRGIIIFNTGSGYKAFDGACPNQDLSACSTLTVSGINATCPCDNAVYSLFTGLSPGKQFPLKEYRTELNGTVITISN